MNTTNIGSYTKAIVSAALAVALAYRQCAADGVVTTAEWWSLVVVAVVAGGGVFAIPNVPAPVARYAKAVTAALAAGIGVVATAAAGGNAIDQAVLINAAVAFFGALGIVAVAPNAAVSDGPGVYVDGDSDPDEDYDPVIDDPADQNLGDPGGDPQKKQLDAEGDLPQHAN